MIATILTIWLVVAAPPNVTVEPPTILRNASNNFFKPDQTPVEPDLLKPAETIHKRGLPPPPVIATLGGGGPHRRSVPPQALERLLGSEQIPPKDGGGDEFKRGGSSGSKPADDGHQRDK